MEQIAGLVGAMSPIASNVKLTLASVPACRQCYRCSRIQLVNQGSETFPPGGGLHSLTSRDLLRARRCACRKLLPCSSSDPITELLIVGVVPYTSHSRLFLEASCISWVFVSKVNEQHMYLVKVVGIGRACHFETK